MEDDFEFPDSPKHPESTSLFDDIASNNREEIVELRERIHTWIEKRETDAAADLNRAKDRLRSVRQDNQAVLSRISHSGNQTGRTSPADDDDDDDAMDSWDELSGRFGVEEASERGPSPSLISCSDASETTESGASESGQASVPRSRVRRAGVTRGDRELEEDMQKAVLKSLEDEVGMLRDGASANIIRILELEESSKRANEELLSLRELMDELLNNNQITQADPFYSTPAPAPAPAPTPAPPAPTVKARQRGTYKPKNVFDEAEDDSQPFVPRSVRTKAFNEEREKQKKELVDFQKTLDDLFGPSFASTSSALPPSSYSPINQEHSEERFPLSPSEIPPELSSEAVMPELSSEVVMRDAEPWYPIIQIFDDMMNNLPYAGYINRSEIPWPILPETPYDKYPVPYPSLVIFAQVKQFCEMYRLCTDASATDIAEPIRRKWREVTVLAMDKETGHLVNKIMSWLSMM